MNYYLVSSDIAENLGLDKIRKSTPSGQYLLSERDLVPYGIPRALEEGAIVLSSNNGGIEPSAEKSNPTGEYVQSAPVEEEQEQEEDVVQEPEKESNEQENEEEEQS